MAEPRLLINQAQLEDAIGKLNVQRIYDDDGDGVADVDTVSGAIADASSKVLGWLGPVYDVSLIDAQQQYEVVRLTKDVARAYAAQRYPEFMRGADGFALMKQAEKELETLRLGMTNLGTKDPPEPAANQGARVLSGNPADPDAFVPRFSDNWGGRGGF